MDCRLCGRPESVIDKKIPCDICKTDYPNAKCCRTCGRIYADTSKFIDDRCLSCENRLKLARERRVVERKSEPGKLSDTNTAQDVVATTRKRTLETDQDMCEKKYRKGIFRIHLQSGSSLPIIIGNKQVAVIST